MLILLEVTYTDKETQAFYPNYTSEDDILSDLETKWGQAMDSDEIHASFLLAFDHTGRIIGQASYSDDEEAITADRLFWITSDAEGEHPDMGKYDDSTKAEAAYHKKRGAAMKPNSGKLALMTMILNGAYVGLKDYWVRTIVPAEQEEPVEE